MIVIIDGYNLIKQVYPKRDDPKIKAFFINELGLYKKIKGSDLKHIILVFDGGGFIHATREIKNGIAIIHSGIKQTADEWIIKYVGEHKQQELLVVTQDREIIQAVSKCAATVLGVHEFYTAMQNAIATKNTIMVASDTQDFIKYKHEESEGADSLLDLLMIQASIGLEPKKDEPTVLSERKPHSKASKEERMLTKKLKKII